MIQEFKRRHTCDSILANFGIPKKGQHYPCPFHEDGTPSLSVFENGQKFKCFGCDAHGDQLDLYCKLSGKDQKQVLAEVNPVKTVHTPKGDYTKVFQEQWKNREQCREYITSRGIDFDKVKDLLGYSEDYITIPVRNQDLQIIGIQSRSISEKKFKISGNSGIFYNAKNPGKELFITEGVMDYLTMRQHTPDVLGFLSASSLPEVSEIIKKYETVYWLGDQDEPGKKLKKQFAQKYQVNLKELFPLSTGEDFNSVFGKMATTDSANFVAYVKMCCFEEKDTDISTAKEHITAILKYFSPENKTKLTWGTRNRDIELTMLEPGQYNVLVGDSGMGKTEFCFYLARENAAMGNRVLYISLEMSTEALIRRYAMRRAGIQKVENLDKNIPAAKLKRLEEIIRDIPENLKFFGGEKITVLEISSQIKKGRYDLVFIDNFGFIDKEGMEEKERYEAISRELVSLKKAQKVCIIALHHFTKNGQRGMGRSIADLRGTGKIENDTDLVIDFTRPSHKDEDASPEDKCAAVIRQFKDRIEGMYSSFVVYFQKGSFFDTFDPSL